MRIIFGLMVVLCLMVAGYALIYVLPEGIIPFQTSLQNRFGELGLPIHAGFGALAISIGWIQFIPSVRQRYTLLHRAIGRVYVFACILSGLAGLVLVIGSYGNLVARAGFAMLAIFWLTTTITGVRLAIAGNIFAHRSWMLRSFALTLAAVSLRLQIPSFEIAGYSFSDFYPIIAWSCWVPNVILVEIWLLVRRDNHQAGMTAA